MVVPGQGSGVDRGHAHPGRGIELLTHVRVMRTGRSQMRSHRPGLTSGASSASPSLRPRPERESGSTVRSSALRVRGPCRCRRSVGFTGWGPGRTWLGLRSAVGVAPLLGAIRASRLLRTDRPAAAHSTHRLTARCSRRAGPPSACRDRSPDLSRGELLCDRVGALSRAAIRPRSRLNVRR